MWWHWFTPGLHESFGDPLAADPGRRCSAVAVFAIWRGREPILRVLGAFVIVTALAYVFTPLTAAGEQGQPIAFVWNVRYLAPAVAVAWRSCPACRRCGRRRGAGRRSWPRSPCCSRSRSARWCSGSRATPRARSPRPSLVLAGAGLSPSCAHAGGSGPAARRRVRVALAVAALASRSPAGYGEQRHYLEHRYENTGPVQDLAARCAGRETCATRGSRSAGIRGGVHAVPVLRHRPLEPGPVAGRPRPARRLPADPELPRNGGGAINAGGYTHVVTTFDPYLPGRLRNSPEGRWTQSDPNAHVVLRDGPVRVFEISGPLDPAGCAGPEAAHAGPASQRARTSTGRRAGD